jgi:hypothetical protein
MRKTEEQKGRRISDLGLRNADGGRREEVKKLRRFFRDVCGKLHEGR